MVYEIKSISIEIFSQSDFYYQLVSVVISLLVSMFGGFLFRQYIKKPNINRSGTMVRERLDRILVVLHEIFFPTLSFLVLGVAVSVHGSVFSKQWLVQAAQGVNGLILLYLITTKVSSVNNGTKFFFLTVLVPIACLYAIDFLDETIVAAEKVKFEIGTISFSLYGVARTLIFGAILFWLGRLSNVIGQSVIRRKVVEDDTARELALKAFQISLFSLIVLLFLQVSGIDLTALVVVGGALGVGLGFGLQQIASNFISGIIILLDRSISIGDHIELEDGRSGVLRELSMRSATLETYDNKDIMVPNERFITTAFVNWSHKDKKQRYSLGVSVSYDTNLESLFDLIRSTVSSHPQVLSGPEYTPEIQPDAEIRQFGDNGIDILIEFWMEGIDDGRNRVSADLLFMIWKAFQENNIEIPFPQTEIRFRGESKNLRSQ